MSTEELAPGFPDSVVTTIPATLPCRASEIFALGV